MQRAVRKANTQKRNPILIAHLGSAKRYEYRPLALPDALDGSLGHPHEGGLGL